jgi:hypothetical protein
MERLWKSIQGVDGMTPKTTWIAVVAPQKTVKPPKAPKVIVQPHCPINVSLSMLREYIRANPGQSQKQMAVGLGWGIKKTEIVYAILKPELYTVNVLKSEVCNG